MKFQLTTGNAVIEGAEITQVEEKVGESEITINGSPATVTIYQSNYNPYVPFGVSGRVRLSYDDFERIADLFYAFKDVIRQPEEPKGKKSK